MKFTLKSTSKYGTAYYVREGFKQTIAIPAVQFAGAEAPAEIEISAPEGVEFAVKAQRVQATGIAKALKELTPEQRKAVREAGRKAEKDALAAAGVSL